MSAIAAGNSEICDLAFNSAVIFGASGDLTNRKLLPAIYNLAQADLLPPAFCVVGFAREAMSEDDFRGRLKKAVATSGDVSLDYALEFIERTAPRFAKDARTILKKIKG